MMTKPWMARTHADTLREELGAGNVPTIIVCAGLDQHQCGRTVSPDVCVDVQPIPDGVAFALGIGARRYICDSCREYLFVEAHITASEFMKLLGAPAIVIAEIQTPHMIDGVVDRLSIEQLHAAGIASRNPKLRPSHALVIPKDKATWRHPVSRSMFNATHATELQLVRDEQKSTLVAARTMGSLAIIETDGHNEVMPSLLQKWSHYIPHNINNIPDLHERELVQEQTKHATKR